MQKGLFKSIFVIMLLLVTFFSVTKNTYSASFAYKDFKWEEFYNQNKNFWVDSCSEDDSECIDEVLASKKRFYTRLYELLASVPSSYGYIDDNYIIATVFYGLDPDSFKDPVEGEDNPYNLDDAEDSTTKDKYIGTVEESEKSTAEEYFKDETDTLKTLINSFIGYNSECLADNGTMATEYSDNAGNSGLTCPNNQYKLIGDKCYPILQNYKGNFFDSIGLDYFGNNNLEDCKELCSEKGMTYYDLKTSSSKEANVEFFFQFLETSDYFDMKPHLREYFKGILTKSGHNTMKEFYEKASDDDKEKFKNDILKARKRIIDGIKSVIEAYGEENFSKISENFNNVNTKMYWWPIGGSETNEVNGVVYATGEPTSIDVRSNFGLRTHPVTGEPESEHKGIDISGELGVTNVISSKDGVIVSVTNNCQDGGDQSCGGGFGNHIIVQHIDNSFTVYAHLASGSVTINIGDSVKQGQVIGKVGNSGRSTGPHLHFEIRMGGNNSDNVQDPLAYISATNPRPSAISNQILEWIGNMEGTGPQEGDNYKVYADSGGVLTVGHGITLKYNADQFLSRGINPSALSVGSLVPKAVVDSIYQEDVNGRLDNIKALLSSHSITLSENQVAALSSLQFNCGNINGFFENYQQYGSSDALCSNWWEQKALHDANGNYLEGLKKRRIAECDLFVNGNYNMNVYG